MHYVGTPARENAIMDLKELPFVSRKIRTGASLLGKPWKTNCCSFENISEAPRSCACPILETNTFPLQNWAYDREPNVRIENNAMGTLNTAENVSKICIDARVRNGLKCIYNYFVEVIWIKKSFADFVPPFFWISKLHVHVRRAIPRLFVDSERLVPQKLFLRSLLQRDYAGMEADQTLASNEDIRRILRAQIMIEAASCSLLNRSWATFFSFNLSLLSSFNGSYTLSWRSCVLGPQWKYLRIPRM